MEIDIELLHKERKQWRENSLLQSKSILRLSQELDNLRKQKEILQEKLLKSATQDQMKKLSWHQKNPELSKAYSKEYRFKNQKILNEKARIKRQGEDGDKIRAAGRLYYYNNKEAKNEYKKRYRARPEIRVKENIYNLKYYHAVWKKNPNARLALNMRNRVCKLLKKINKSKSTMKLLGCTIEELWQHLEKQFQPGMTKENYGKWHVDHIIACAKFDLSKFIEQNKCFHYTNLQPLWALDNIKKGAK